MCIPNVSGAFPALGKVVLSSEQAAALHAARKWFHEQYPAKPVFRLFGYAGTGKSTVTAALIERLGIAPSGVVYVAPTGKAAKIMTAKGCPAKTIHKQFYKLIATKEDHWAALGHEKAGLLTRLRLSPDNSSAARWAERVKTIEAELREPAPDDIEFRFVGLSNVGPETRIIVVDEASMLTDDNYADLVGVGLPVVLIGDPGQLPPVKGASDGETTRAMSNPNVTLTQIQRQADGSSILDIAELARHGEYIAYGNDGRGISVRDGTKAGKLHLALRRARLTMEDLAGYDQIICGKNATRLAINELMREHHVIQSRYPTGATGEKLIVVKNYETSGEMIPNGSMIRIQSTGEKGNTRAAGGKIIDYKAKIVEIDDEPANINVTIYKTPFEGNNGPDLKSMRLEALWAKKTLNVEWGWAITAHKAQGSQWDKVLVFDESKVFQKDSCKWLYTAVTRAAKELTIIRI